MLHRIKAFLNPPTEDRGYTEAFVTALWQQATGQVLGISAAEEIAAGLLGRAFASAEVEGSDAVRFPPDVMMTIGRDLMIQGESVWQIATPMRWQESYDFTRSGNYVFSGVPVNARNVFHARYAVDRVTGRGTSPIDCVPRFRKMLRQLEQVIEYETRACGGYLIPVPIEGGNLTQLRSDIKALQGRSMLVETTAGGYGDRMSAPRKDYDQKRLGPDIPLNIQKLYEDTQKMALGVYGVPAPIVYPTDASSMREGWRIYLHSTIEPMAHLMIASARNAGLRIELSFDRLMASDVMGRARAFNSMVSGGMEIGEAAEISGLLGADLD